MEFVRDAVFHFIKNPTEHDSYLLHHRFQRAQSRAVMGLTRLVQPLGSCVIVNQPIRSLIGNYIIPVDAVYMKDDAYTVVGIDFGGRVNMQCVELMAHAFAETTGMRPKQIALLQPIYNDRSVASITIVPYEVIE